MCGILGWIGQHSPEDLGCFDAALDLLAHRGPDDRGVWSAPGVLLGHRRLSILDLSAAGHQPMVEPASGAVIVFNGEIYNHVELRAQLERLDHRFVGHSDTEVLLHALIEWGADALGRLNGMWAFALWHPGTRRLLLARDRFGVKPLYYRMGAGGMAFASEPKALLSLFPEHRNVSEPILLDFLANNLLYARGESFYEGIHVMPPAHFGVFEMDSGGWSQSRYWNYPQDTDERLGPDEAVAQFDELFTDAVRLRLRSDVPVGLTLSGGLDSTGVLAAAGRNTDNSALTCFTSVYDEAETGELSWARLAADAARAPLLPVSASSHDWLATLRKVVWHMDAPGYSPAVYPLWYLMAQARAEGIPVLLEGQGADEALAGYPQYAVLDLLSYVSGGPARSGNSGLLARVSSLRSAFSLRWTAAWLMREISPALLRWHRRRNGFESLLRAGIALPPAPEPIDAGDGDRVRQRLMMDHARDILPGLLHYGDAISMAHGIEARNPFMDYRLVEWMFRLPGQLRFRDAKTKWVLREYLRSNGQQKISARPDKQGYPTPVARWLATERGREVESLLLDKSSVLHEWCDPDKIRRLIEQNKQGAIAAEHHLYKLVSTQLWLNECIELR